MDKEFSSVGNGESSPLQNHMSCKICAFVGQNLVKHYVEFHPGAEIPVCLTPKELNTLKRNINSPVQQPMDTATQEDTSEIVINFLNKLGQTSTFTNPITCPLCSYRSVVKSELVSHLVIHQTANLKCFFCLVTEGNLSDFRDHIATHTGEYAYQCIHCRFRGAFSSDVPQHISRNHPGREAKTICENVSNSNGDYLKGYVCSTCGFIQMAKSSVERHVSAVDLSCRGSFVIELDISKGRKGASTATVVKGGYNTAAPSSEYIQNSELQKPGRNVSNLDPSSHSNNIVQNQVCTQNDATNKTLTLSCASCLFNTLDEDEFIKHAKTQHKPDLSLWCKSCGKCFSNAGVLVNHIKESLCVKEDINYRCGVKECTFETPNGQNLVIHLKQFHKGSPLIFCVHCQKFFTLPHCLILHIQNDCPNKEKHRRFPGQAARVIPPISKPTEAIATVKSEYTPPSLPKEEPSLVSTQSVASFVPPVVASETITAKPEGKGRGRGKRKIKENVKSKKRGRGRGKVVASDSSDSDPDDPAWNPEDVPPHSIRRSSRASKKSEVSNSGYSSNKGGSFGDSFACTCCDFSAKSNALLENHFLTIHKKPDKMGCLVCNLKFKSTQNFLQHFVLHKNDKSRESVEGDKFEI